MARFLLLTGAAAGHVNPVMQIARKLIERGHEVVWITGRRYEDRVESTGARFHPYPAEIDPGVMEIYDFFPEYGKLKGLAQTKYMFKHMCIDLCPQILETIDTVLADFPADVLVGDPVIWAPYVKSLLGGPPSALIFLTPLALSSRDTAPYGLGILPGNNLVTRIRDRILNFIADQILLRDVTIYLNDAIREWGLPPIKPPFLRAMFEMPSLVMQLSTAAFEYPRSDMPEHVHYIGPVLPEPTPSFQPPAWWPDLSRSETVVLVNQGTIAKNLDDLVAPTIEALRGRQALVIAVPVAEGELGDLPAYVRAEPFIPFDKLLPHVGVMVSNGGYGGTQFALAHGIPLILAGETEDKMEVAARVEWAGAGINLRKQRPSPQEIREAVAEVLSNPAYGENARRIQADFAKHDAPTKAAELLEALIGLASEPG
jgi:MGT family glycosyltransferase